jgi:uncharacterized membrane protein
MDMISGRAAGRGGWRGNGARQAPARWDSRVGHDQGDERLASFLGWFSIGLGLTQVMAPREFARCIGVSDDAENRALTRMIGLRELASGVGILTRPRPAGWVWARVAGDVMDIALLGNALTSGAPRPDRVAAATAAVLGVTALDVYDAIQLSQRSGPSGDGRESRGFDVTGAITVKRPAEELYRFWHDFQNLPRFMSHLESVQVTGDRRSHWKARGPAGKTVEWDAEIVEDRPNELIAWRSLEGADVDNSGAVRFVPAPGGRGTEVHVEMRYDPPGGAIGAAIAKLFGESPEQQLKDDLLHFKQVMETGEVVLSDASLDGSGLIQRPAQPPEQLPAALARR